MSVYQKENIDIHAAAAAAIRPLGHKQIKIHLLSIFKLMQLQKTDISKTIKPNRYLHKQSPKSIKCFQ
jgi:hypothetical protein